MLTGMLTANWKTFIFDCFIQMSYVWTDQRLAVLVTNFFNYVYSQDTRDSYVLLLQHLREPLLELTDEEANDYPGDAGIINKLSEIAESYKNKTQHYFGLKIRLGKPACKELRALVKHERFNEYLPPDAKPTRVTDVNVSNLMILIYLFGLPSNFYCALTYLLVFSS